MNLKRVWHIFKKDLAVGPRSPLLVFMLVLPLVMTLAVQLIFTDFSGSDPRLAVYAAAPSDLLAELERLPGLRLTRLDSQAGLLAAVEAHDYDAGLVLPAGFDARLRAGDKPLLELYFSGESYAVDRLVLAVNTIDAIRTVEGQTPPLRVELVNLSAGAPVPLATRLIPVVVFYAFVIAGLFAPASLLVEEKERRTLVALLTTPAKMTEVVLAKGLLGVLLAFALAAMTLAMNRVVVVDLGGLVVSMLITSVFWAMLGVLIGLLSKNSEMLFGIVKGSGIVLFGPVVFYLFPDWPQWIARLFPTFWAVDPLWQLMANDARLADVFWPLAIVAGMCLLMVPLIVALSRRALRQFA
jgi:ABC-2 type transport system permease protein